MQQSKRDSRIIVILILGSFVTGLLSVAPSVDSPRFLHLAEDGATQTVWAAVFQFLMGCCYAGIIILFYPRIKTVAPKLALGALSFRFLSIGLSLVGTILLGTVLIFSQQFVDLGMSEDAIWIGVGTTLKQTRDMINHGWMILSLGIGNFILYAGLLKGRLIPAWMSWLGIFGTALSCLASVFILFRMVDVISGSYLLMNLPTAVFELILAGCLIFRGFKM